LGPKGLEQRAHLGFHLRDRPLEGVDLSQMEPQQEAVMIRHASLERLGGL